MSDDILYDLRHKQRLQEPRDMHKEPLWGRAADEIERLRGLLREVATWRIAVECVAPELGGLLMTFARIDAALAGAAVQPPVLNERDARDPVVEAQHDETGRMWRGRRSMIPRRYFECVTPSPTDAAP